MKKITSQLSKLITVTACLFFALLANTLQAQVTNYWDINGASQGSGGPTPNGDWDDMSAGGFWTTDPTGMSATGPWVERNTPVFSALNGVGATTTDATGSYTITVGTDHTIAGMQTAPGSGPVTVSGAGPLHIAAGMQGFIGTNLTINTPLVDTGGYQDAVGNNVFLNDGGGNTFSGGFNFNGGWTHITTATALGSGLLQPINAGFSALFIDGGGGITLGNSFSNGVLNAGIDFVTSSGNPVTFSGGVDLEQTFSCELSGPAGNDLTFSGVISGPGGLSFSGNSDNSEVIVLSGSNTFSGKVTLGPTGGSRITVLFSSIEPIGSTIANNLGLPANPTDGQIDLGHSGFADPLRYNSTFDSTTDRTLNNINTTSVSGAGGGMWLYSDGAGAITYSNITAVNATTSTAGGRTVVLQGISTALNTICGTISDGVGGGPLNVVNVTKESPSTWVLSGSNTFTGSLTVQNTTGLGGTSTLIVGGSNVYTNATTISSASILQLAAANPLPHGLGYGKFSVNSGGTFELAGFDCSIDGGGSSAGSTIDNNTGTATLTVVANGPNNGPNFAGVIQDSGSGVLNFAANCTGNCTLSASGGNTYHGYIALSNAVLVITADNQLGSTTGSLVPNRIIIDSNLGWTGTANMNNYYVRVQGSGGINIDLDANRGIYLGNAQGYGGGIGVQSTAVLNVHGPISGPGGLWIGGGTANAATGPVTLFNTSPGSTYAGGTYIVAGQLKLGDNNVLPTGTPLTLSDSGGAVIFDMQTFNQTIGPLTGVNNNNSLKLSGALIIKQTGNTTFNGVLSLSGTLTLDATSSGTLTLAGTSANTFNGAVIVNGGTLELGKASALASTSLTVATAGKLKLSNASSIPTAATLNLAATPNAGTVNLNFSGTQNITALNFGGTSMAKGTWGRIGSGALHESNVFDATGNGLLNVTSSTITPTATSVSTISGTALSYNMGAGNWFVLLGTNNVAAPLSQWSRLATNGSTPASFTIPAVGSQPQMFYRVKSE